MPSSLLAFDADQQTSAVDKDSPQNDRWRTEQITPRQSPSFSLLAVVDGEGQNRPGETASLAVDVAFAEARSRRDEPLPELLRHIVEQVNNIVCHRGAGDMVGATFAAVQDNTVWVAQAGSQTRCYRVRGRGQAVLLAADNDLPLGCRPSVTPEPAVAHRLRQGDKLVLCSDGLYASGLVSPVDIAKIDRYDDIKGAARHLSALAMGRNVRDNVTVLVASYGRSRRLPMRRLLYELLAILGAAIIIVLLGLLIAYLTRKEPRHADRGVAVLAGGAAVEIDQFGGVILPKSELNILPGSPVHIQPKRIEQDGSTSTISGVDLYFGPDSHLELAAVDVEGFTDPPAGIQEETNLTEVALYSGQALVLSSSSETLVPGSSLETLGPKRGPQTFYVWLGAAQDAKVPLIVLEGPDAALGVDHQDGQASAYCLRGSCSIHLGRKFKSFDAGTWISLETGTAASLDALTRGSVSAQDYALWSGLCSASYARPEIAPPACQALDR